MEGMGVIEAKIQTVEDIYRLVRTAVVGNVRFAQSITAMLAGSARIGWAGIAKARGGCFANGALARVAVDCNRRVRRPIGVVSLSRN